MIHNAIEEISQRKMQLGRRSGCWATIYDNCLPWIILLVLQYPYPCAFHSYTPQNAPASHITIIKPAWCVCSLGCVRPFSTPWTSCQALLSMEFSRQEYWSGLPFSSPGDIPDPGIEPKSLESPFLVGGFFTTSTTWEIQKCTTSPQRKTAESVVTVPRPDTCAVCCLVLSQSHFGIQ